VVHEAAAPVERRDGEVRLIAPTVRSILAAGLPGFLREGFLPLGAFYVGWRLSGLGAGIAASAAASVAVYALERRAGRDGLLVKLSLAFVAVQTVIGLLSHSTVLYLVTPVLANGVWAAAFLGSAVVGRPLAGTFACAWYPFPREFRATAEFRRVYGVESVVWGVYLLSRSALRLAALLYGSVGAFLVVAFLTGTPAMLGLVAWSIWYAIRRFSASEPALP
jgi:MFS family permease